MTHDKPKAITFHRAVKRRAKGRVALVGPGGSGKSYTGLVLARVLAGPTGRVAGLDTEAGSLSKYADVFNFDVIEPESFSTQTFLTALHSAEDGGYDVFLCDSLSHFWMGKDGALEYVDMAAKRNKDGMGGWKEFRPQEREMLDAILKSRCHVIVTMRTKNDYVEQVDPNTGQKRRVKIGLAPVQRDGLEYEFDLVGYMDDTQTFITDKTRCSVYLKSAISLPGPTYFEPFATWLEGVTPEERAAVAPQPQIDTGGNATGTVAAAQYVAAQKLASPNLETPLKSPWSNMRRLRECFASVEARVGAIECRAELEKYGWRDLGEVVKAIDVRDKAAKEIALENANKAYWHLDARARQEGK